jgi:hypothetical protein
MLSVVSLGADGSRAGAPSSSCSSRCFSAAATSKRSSQDSASCTCHSTMGIRNVPTIKETPPAIWRYMLS